MSTDKYTTPRFVMRSYPAQGDVEHLASEYGWIKESTDRKQPPFSGVHVTWNAPNLGHIKYVEDEMTENCYLVATAATRDDAQSLGSIISNELLPWELPELLWAVDNAPDELELGFSIIRLGIASPPVCNIDIFNRINSALMHEDPRVRDMAIMATAHSPWPEYVPPLQYIEQNDTSKKLRQRSQLVLQSYADANIWKG